MRGMEENRIIALLDVDSFSVQIHLKKNPEYKGYPCVVVHKGFDAR